MNDEEATERAAESAHRWGAAWLDAAEHFAWECVTGILGRDRHEEPATAAAWLRRTYRVVRRLVEPDVQAHLVRSARFAMKCRLRSELAYARCPLCGCKVLH